eukprot:SAG11_NODE_22656_length_402_cov_1.188119_1_plen_45_part_10
MGALHLLLYAMLRHDDACVAVITVSAHRDGIDLAKRLGAAARHKL